MIEWTFDSSDYKPGGHFKPVPPGDYRVRIKNAEETYSKTGNQMIKLELEVSGTQLHIWHYIVFPNQNVQDYKKAAQRCNQALGEIWESFNMKVGNMDVSSWIGKVGAARLKLRFDDYSGEDRNQISYFLTRKRQEGLSAWSEPGGNNSMSLRSDAAFNPANDANLPF